MNEKEEQQRLCIGKLYTQLSTKEASFYKDDRGRSILAPQEKYSPINSGEYILVLSANNVTREYKVLRGSEIGWISGRNNKWAVVGCG